MTPNSTARTPEVRGLEFYMENLDSAKWRGGLTLEVTSRFFQYLCNSLQWLRTEGKALLEREEPLDYTEWSSLLNTVRDLHQHVGRNAAISAFYKMVVKKGISSLSQRTGAETIQDNWNWFERIVTLLSPSGVCGVGSHNCKDEESREMIESLIPISQRLQYGLASLAISRFPGDESAQNDFVAKHTNW